MHPDAISVRALKVMSLAGEGDPGAATMNFSDVHDAAFRWADHLANSELSAAADAEGDLAAACSADGL